MNQASPADFTVDPKVRVAQLKALPTWLALGAIRLYQATLSPVLPLLLGPNCGCRFHPTCSHYATEAVRTHGVLAGTWLTFRRLLRCQPLHPGGLDPVPLRYHRLDRHAKKPVCRGIRNEAL